MCVCLCVFVFVCVCVSFTCVHPPPPRRHILCHTGDKKSDDFNDLRVVINSSVSSVLLQPSLLYWFRGHSNTITGMLSVVQPPCFVTYSMDGGIGVWAFESKEAAEAAAAALAAAAADATPTPAPDVVGSPRRSKTPKPLGSPMRSAATFSAETSPAGSNPPSTVQSPLW